MSLKLRIHILLMYLEMEECWHHGLGCPKVAVIADGFQLWREVVANILNKPTRTADKEWF
jgi:hypothetical protein